MKLYKQIKKVIKRHYKTLLIELCIGIAMIMFAFGAFAQDSGSVTISGNEYAGNETVKRTIFAKIVTGSVQSKFNPDGKTTLKFAITTLCKAGKWTRSKTFTACRKIAQNQGLIGEGTPIGVRARSTSGLTYAQLAFLLEKVKTLSPAPAPVPPSPTPVPAPAPAPVSAFSGDIPARAASSLSFTPYPETTISTDNFAHILLNAQIPNRFYKDEVYNVEGDVGGMNTDQVFIFICKENQSCDNSTNFIEKTSGSHFKIPVHFSEVGNYQLGIIPGRSGQSRVENISVVPGPDQIGQIGPILAPSSLNVVYAAGKTTFSWSGQGKFTDLIIFQGQRRRDYIFRQKINSFSPDSQDFAAFAKDAAGWAVQIDNGVSAPEGIGLTVNDFRTLDTTAVTVNSMTESFAAPTQFTFSGTAVSTISKRAALTFPNGTVQELSAGSGDIGPGRQFSIGFNMASSGTYIFEVNNPQGAAVLNVPIYVGRDLPLLPDFVALHSSQLDTSPIGNIATVRQTALALLNKDRAAQGLAALTLNNDLNAIAQHHSDDMVSRTFFAHVNPDGLSPDDRRKNAQYPTAIRENLGKASSLELVEYGLMRSPIHREAIIDPNMKRVGIGITKSGEGYYFVTQNFSGDPLTGSNLGSIEDQLFASAQAARQAGGLSSMTHDASLRNAAAGWSSRMAQEKFFSVTANNGDSLLDFVRSKGINSALQAYIVQASQQSQLADELAKQPALLSGSNQKIGIGLGVNGVGDLFMTVLYTP